MNCQACIDLSARATQAFSRWKEWMLVRNEHVGEWTRQEAYLWEKYSEANEAEKKHRAECGQ